MKDVVAIGTVRTNGQEMVIGEDIQQEMLASLQPNLINHSQITRVTLFIKLFLVSVLSFIQR